MRGYDPLVPRMEGPEPHLAIPTPQFLIFSQNKTPSKKMAYLHYNSSELLCDLLVVDKQNYETRDILV